MKFPFVSRARLDQAVARIAELERERQQWANAYLAAKGLEPVFLDPMAGPAPISVTAKNPPAGESAADKPLPTMATFAHIETVANQAAQRGGVADWLASRRKVSA